MGILGSVEEHDRKRILFEREPDPVDDLAHYLIGEFQSGEPLQVTTRRSGGVGRQLSDREVSRLEVISAIQRLPHRQRRIMELVYVDGMHCSAAALRLNISERTLYRERAAAIETMVGIIYEWSRN